MNSIADLPASFEIITEYLGDDITSNGEAGALLNFPALFAASIHQVLGNIVEWHVVFTDDFNRSVRDRTQDAVYSDDRGSNTVAARTLVSADGVIWFVMSTAILSTLEDATDESVNKVKANIIHLGVHEAHHAILAIAAEAEEDFEDQVAIEDVQRLYRKACSINLNECRIERAANSVVAASPARASTIEGDIHHFAREYSRSRSLIQTNIGLAAQTIMTAGNELAKALAYLAAELEPTSDTDVPMPAPIPEGWEEYIGPFWPEFYRAYRSVPPANERVKQAQLVGALECLCLIMPSWMEHIGIHYDLDADGNHRCFWTK